MTSHDYLCVKHIPHKKPQVIIIQLSRTALLSARSSGFPQVSYLNHFLKRRSPSTCSIYNHINNQINARMRWIAWRSELVTSLWTQWSIYLLKIQIVPLLVRGKSGQLLVRASDEGNEMTDLVLRALYPHHLPTLHSFRWKHDSPKHCWLAVGLQQPAPCAGFQRLWYSRACVWIQGQ